jgi:hypothetical protein
MPSIRPCGASNAQVEPAELFRQAAVGRGRDCGPGPGLGPGPGPEPGPEPGLESDSAPGLKSEPEPSPKSGLGLDRGSGCSPAVGGGRGACQSAACGGREGCGVMAGSRLVKSQPKPMSIAITSAQITMTLACRCRRERRPSLGGVGALMRGSQPLTRQILRNVSHRRYRQHGW